MTLKQAHDCLSNDQYCAFCEYRLTKQETNCRQQALNIGATALDYLRCGMKLAEEAEKKNA